MSNPPSHYLQSAHGRDDGSPMWLPLPAHPSKLAFPAHCNALAQTGLMFDASSASSIYCAWEKGKCLSEVHSARM